MAEKFEQWAILEIMGHQTYAGLVSEQTVGGASFVRIDVPPNNGIEAFTKLFGAASIYAITPVTEAVARQRAAGLRQSPMSIYDFPEAIRDRLRTPALEAPHRDDAYDDDSDIDDSECP